MTSDKVDLNIGSDFFKNWHLETKSKFEKCCLSEQDSLRRNIVIENIAVFSKWISKYRGESFLEIVDSLEFENGEKMLIYESYSEGNMFSTYRIRVKKESDVLGIAHGFNKKKFEPKEKVREYIDKKIRWDVKDCCIEGIPNIETHPIRVYSLFQVNDSKLKLEKLTVSLRSY